MTNKTRPIQFATYAPFRKYHTRRVQKLKQGPLQRFWYRYNHDLTFQRFIDSGCLAFATGLATIAVITILFLIS